MWFIFIKQSTKFKFLSQINKGLVKIIILVNSSRIFEPFYMELESQQ
jgi:hypothetical protein